jgi:hypothetical protein
MSPTGIAANRLELLQIAEAVAREKSIDREVVISAIEEAIQKGARARYGAEHDIRVYRGAGFDAVWGKPVPTAPQMVADVRNFVAAARRGEPVTFSRVNSQLNVVE